jgi:methionyl aminopeptidase
LEFGAWNFLQREYIKYKIFMITIKNDKEIELLREGGKILANIIEKLKAEIKPGVTTGHLEQMACFLIKEAGGRPSFKGYKSRQDSVAFPTALCASINDEIVHTPALPSRRLNAGDIIGIDLGMEYPKSAKLSFGGDKSGASPVKAGDNRGYYTDMAVTVGVGQISKEAKKLIRVTKESLELAIKQVKPGNTISDISRAVQNFVEANGFSVVRDLVGHGVGYAVHEDPQVPNYVVQGKKFNDVILKPGMVLAIEPMVNVGSCGIQNMPDGLTIKTVDGQLSAHFEHTVAVTGDGCEVLTRL